MSPSGGSEDEGDASRQVFARAAAILRTLEDAAGGLTIADITRASGLPRTTVSRLVRALEAENFVSTRNGRVRLGPALLRLAVAANLDVVALVRPHIEQLSHETGETVHLWIERKAAVEMIDEVASAQEVRCMLARGFSLSFTNSAPGKAFLSGLPVADVIDRLDGELQNRDPAFADRFLAELEIVRRDGIALDIEEHAKDVCAVAQVVSLGLPERYAIAIAVPARRFSEKRADLEQKLKDCIASIEAMC